MDNATRLAILVLSAVLSACMARQAHVEPPVTQVLFVCEHGNVKSLMAASYFNELVRARDLPFRAVSRGTKPDADTVPDFVRRPLSAEGFDVSSFRPQTVTTDDISASGLVITIGTTLSASESVGSARLEEWNDIPAASTSYAQSRESLKARVADLLQRLERSGQLD